MSDHKIVAKDIKTAIINMLHLFKRQREICVQQGERDGRYKKRPKSRDEKIQYVR